MREDIRSGGRLRKRRGNSNHNPNPKAKHNLRRRRNLNNSHHRGPHKILSNRSRRSKSKVDSSLLSQRNSSQTCRKVVFRNKRLRTGRFQRLQLLNKRLAHRLHPFHNNKCRHKTRLRLRSPVNNHTSRRALKSTHNRRMHTCSNRVIHHIRSQLRPTTVVRLCLFHIKQP